VIGATVATIGAAAIASSSNDSNHSH
jgi:hypothetical protein